MPLTERDYDLLSLYIDDALTPPERRAIESRLKSDAEFRAELDALRRTVALVKSLPEMVAPRDLRLTPKIAADVLAELKAAQPAPKTRPTMIYRLTTIAAAAASLVLVFAGALTLLQPGMSPRPAMTANTSATVAVAEAVLTEEISTETPTLKTDDDGTTMGLMIPQGTFEPFATGGFGGAGDPMMDTATMQEAAETGEAGFFSSAPAPVMTDSEEPPSMMEEMEAPEDAGDVPGAVSSPAPTATLASTLAAAGSVGGLDLTATQDAAAVSRAAAATPLGSVLPAPSPAPDEAGTQAEMVAVPTMTAEPTVEVIETVVADMRNDRDAQDEAQDLTERAPITETSSPILGFALVIAGIALGVVALIMVVRTG